MYQILHLELTVKYNVGLKILQKRHISEPVFNGDLVYELKRNRWKPFFMTVLKIHQSYQKSDI